MGRLDWGTDWQRVSRGHSWRTHFLEALGIGGLIAWVCAIVTLIFAAGVA